MNKKFYITTPLYYVNAAPHIGHAYTTLAADVLARFYRTRGQEVHLLTGTDEHGANIEKIAQRAGVEPKIWADKMAVKFKDLWTHLDIVYDDFIRTTEERHESRVKTIFQKLRDKGDIYPGIYQGFYCLPCENYWDESDLENGNCPIHHQPVEKIQEPTYFFRLSKYKEPLLTHYKTHPEFLMPAWRAKEIVNFVRAGLNDISVSRTKVKWGIPVPGDQAHTIYVWFDALLNYITATGYRPDDREGHQALWPADVQLVGKEIFRFHTVIWPAMLLALEVPLPQMVFAHGWWTVEGEKMSSTKGNFVDPREVTAEFGVDSFRYFVLREVPFGNDGNFSRQALRQRYNSELANDLGNLVSRVVHMVDRYLDGELPAKPPLTRPFLSAEIAKESTPIAEAIERLAFHEALNRIWGVLRRLNRDVDQKKPWEKAKSDLDDVRLLLFDWVWCLRIVAGWLYPFMPRTAAAMQARLGVRNPDPGKPFPGKERFARIEKGPPLFPRK